MAVIRITVYLVLNIKLRKITFFPRDRVRFYLCAKWNIKFGIYNYLLIYLLTYLHHGAKSFLRS